MGEFGGLMITSPGAISDAARAVREKLGESPGTTSSPRNPQYTEPARADSPAASLAEPAPDAQAPAVQASTRLGDISSQFGKLIIDGLQAVSGAFRKGKAPETTASHPQQSAPAPAPVGPDLESRPAGLSDRFSRLIMDKFRAIVDSRFQEKVKPERDSLTRAIDATPNPIVHEEVRRNMDAFERRAQADRLEASAVQNTYRSALFLVEDPRKQSCLDATERLLLALQVVRLAAYPDQVCSGRFATAEIASMESRIYNLYPSAAAHLVTEIALYNEFRSYSGLHIVLPADELHPDVESRDPIGNGGMNRSYASQIFQQAAMNLHYARNGVSGMQVHYRLNPIDSSEELVALDGAQLAINSSARSINAQELCHDIAADQMPR